MNAYKEGRLCCLPYKIEVVEPHGMAAKAISFEGAFGMKDVELLEHEKAGHYPKHKGCDVCERAFARQRVAYKGGLPREASTTNVDMIDWGSVDANGVRYTLTCVMLGTSCTDIENQGNKLARTTEASWNRLKARIEIDTDPGGDWKVGRVHKDSGSEFQGGFRDACAR